jgi:hypothetical protein
MKLYAEMRRRIHRWKNAYWGLFCDDMFFYVVNPIFILFVFYPFMLPYYKVMDRYRIHPPQV